MLMLPLGIHMNQESLMVVIPRILTSIMLCNWLDSELILLAEIIGQSETVGVLIMEKMGSLE